MKNNETGNITLFALFTLFSIFYIGSTLLAHKLSSIKQSKNQMQNYLCMKEYTGEIKRHNEVIEITNTGIKAANTGTILGLFTSPALALTAKRLKSLLKRTQDIYHFSFLKKVSSLYSKDCQFTPTAFKTNYQTKSFYLKLSRNQSGTVKERKKEWKVYSGNKSSLLVAKFHNQKLEVKESSLINMVKALLK